MSAMTDDVVFDLGVRAMNYTVERRRAQLLVVDAEGYVACVVPFRDARGEQMAERICKLLNVSFEADVQRSCFIDSIIPAEAEL